MRLDLDTLTGLKKEAAEKGLPYQTLINSILKRHVKSPDLVERVERLERKIG